MPSEEWEYSPVGLAMMDRTGRVSDLNSTGRAILSDLHDAQRPLEHAKRSLEGLAAAGKPSAGQGARPEEPPSASAGWSTGWIRVQGRSLELAYRVSAAGEDYAVAFYDVTQRRQRERRAMAVARTAARVASERSLPATLSALAHEILQADGLAGVQVLTNEHSGDKLHMLGMAGFPASRSSSFFSLLMECRRRGASLRMLDAFDSGEPVVIPHRYEEVMSNPVWEPLHDFHRYPVWDAFASVPIRVRQKTIGILNVFVAPGQELDGEAVEFLTSMAEQAGLAIDYASLLEEERSAAQREERSRLARDLHDSVVQQVFSMSMLTSSLGVLFGGENTGDDARVRSIAAELEDISGSVMKDLRRMVAQLHPSAVEGIGLRTAIGKLAARTHRQTGVGIDLDIDPDADQLPPEQAEDLYFVVAEAVHNALKHSPADLVVVSLSIDAGRIRLAIRDNGGKSGGPSADAPEEKDGHGLYFMRQRIERWDGKFSVNLNFGGVGSEIRADLPPQANRFPGGLHE